LAVLGFELKLSYTSSYTSTTWAMPPASPSFPHSGYFWDRVSLFAWAGLDYNLPIYTSQSSWDDRCSLPHQAFFVEKQTFCLGWPWTTILLILASWVARIIGLSYCAHLKSVLDTASNNFNPSNFSLDTSTSGFCIESQDQDHMLSSISAWFYWTYTSLLVIFVSVLLQTHEDGGLWYLYH
jgi:hypothetical protein